MQVGAGTDLHQGMSTESCEYGTGSGRGPHGDGVVAIMANEFGLQDEGFTLSLAQLSGLSIAEAFVLAGGLVVMLIILAALAMLVSRWLSHSLDRVFEWLLLLGLGALLAWLVLRTGGIPGLGL